MRRPLDAVFAFELWMESVSRASAAKLMASSPFQSLVRLRCQVFAHRRDPTPSTLCQAATPAHGVNERVQRAQRGPPECATAQRGAPLQTYVDWRDRILSAPGDRWLYRCGSYPPPNLYFGKRAFGLHGLQPRSMEKVCHFYRPACFSCEEGRIECNVANISAGHVQVSQTCWHQLLRRCLSRKYTRPDRLSLCSVRKRKIHREAQPALK